MKKLVLFILVLLCFSAAHAQKLVTARTVVSGRMVNLDSINRKVVAVNYCDPLSEGSKVAVRLSSSGEFHTSYDMTFKQNITIVYNGIFINLFAGPSDSIFVEIDVKRLNEGDWGGVKFTGSSAAENNEVNGLLAYLYPLINVDLDMALPPDQFIDSFKTLISSLNDSLVVYDDKNKLSNYVRSWSERDLKFIAMNYICDYGSGREDDMLRVLTDPMFDLYNDNNFTTMYFASNLYAVLTAILSGDARYRELSKEGNVADAAIFGVEILGSLPASLTRDMLVYIFMLEVAKVNVGVYEKLPQDIFVNQLIADRLRALCTTPKSGSISAAMVPIKGVSYLKNDSIVEVVKEQDILTYLAARYPGKILYVDVYATWCGQCIADFAYNEHFHNLFVRNDMVFINLCLSSDQNRWISTVSKYKLKGENYFFDSDATHLFMSTYGLSGYPSYLLIDRSGKLVTNRAPRPSSMTKAAEMIGELLK